MSRGCQWMLPAAVAALWAAQTNPAIVREGRYWVQTMSGTAVLQASELLRVSTRGPVSVQGEDRADVAYTLKKRAGARDEATARALLDRISVTTAKRGRELVVEVRLPADWAASASLRLLVPRNLRETVLESQGDSIEATDLKGTLRADSSGGQVQVDRIDGNVIVRTGGGCVRLGKIGGDVQCFSGGGQIIAETITGEAGLNTEGGEILVRVAKGPVRASTAGGNIRIEQAAGGVTATAKAGLIDVARSSGPVVAQTGAGAIKIRSAGNVHCQVETGPIALESVYGGLRAVTRSGSIMAELAGRPLKDSTLTSGSGDITIFIPSNLAVTVQAISASPGGRRIISDFTEIRPRLAPGARYQAEGALNGGGPVLKLTALGGTVYLRRQK